MSKIAYIDEESVLFKRMTGYIAGQLEQQDIQLSEKAVIDLARASLDRGVDELNGEKAFAGFPLIVRSSGLEGAANGSSQRLFKLFLDEGRHICNSVFVDYE